jgi:hypothetical protein
MSLLLANEKPAIETFTENTLDYYINRTLEILINFKSRNQTKTKTMVQFRNGSLEEL